MDDCKVFVGLDYHKDSVQVCVENEGGEVLVNRRCHNDWQSIVRATNGHGIVSRVAIESCSGAANLADELVHEAGWSVDLAHPGYVHRMKGSPDKTDFSDARMLADLERVGYLPKVWLAPHDVRELRRLVRYRQGLVGDRRNTKLRISALLRDQRIRNAPAGPWTKPWLCWLRTNEALSEQSRWIVDRLLAKMDFVIGEIAEVEKRLSEATKDDPMVKALCALKGIGFITAWTIRAEIGRFDRFNSGKQLARFCGLSPRNASSGARVADAGLIKAGNRQLRSTLIEAAHRLIRFDLEWVKFAGGLLDRGKPKCVVVTAVANRWVRWLFHQMQPTKLAA
jgi:transposase